MHFTLNLSPSTTTKSWHFRWLEMVGCTIAGKSVQYAVMMSTDGRQKVLATLLRCQTTSSPKLK